MASPIWAKSVGMGAKLRLKVGRENEPNDFLKQFVRPGWHPQGTHFFRVFLLDVDASNGSPSIAFISQELNDSVYLAQGHCVHRLRRRSFGHRSFIPIDFPIGM